jgi:hypothetical protein
MKLHSGVKAPPFLTSVLHGCEWSASRSFRFTPGEIATHTHCIRGWVDPRACIDSAEKRKIACFFLESNLVSLAFQPVA